MYPIKLKAAYMYNVWGGRKLIDRYGKKTDEDRIAESWELSCSKGAESVAENGEFAGRKLTDILSIHPEYAGKNCEKFEFFPVLVKLIDAKTNLSVQVHPDDGYALKNEGQYGKTEMWYVVECEEGAGLYCGFKKPVAKSELEAALRDGSVTELLNFIKVRKGDSIFIPSGTVHAICGGLLVYEVQQNSTLTYRLYDYGRLGTDGKPRELHIEKALEVSDLSKVCKPGDGAEALGKGVLKLSDCDYFTSIRYTVPDCRSAYVDEDSFVALTCVEGSAAISSCGQSLTVNAGDTVFLPAGSGEVRFDGEAVIIVASAGNKRQ